MVDKFQFQQMLKKYVNYLFVPCRYKGFHEFVKSKGIDVGVPVGLDVIVDGTVPTGGFTLPIFYVTILKKMKGLFYTVFWKTCDLIL